MPASDRRSLRRAATLSLGGLLRLQHRGTLAFHQGASVEAMHFLDRTITESQHSKPFNAMTLMLIALLRLDEGDGVRLQARWLAWR